MNILLYIPLGAALVATGRSGARPVAYGFFLSCAIEFAQIAIPGRDPSIGDVCFNTLGAAAGQGLAWLVRRWLLPDDRSSARLSLLAAAGGVAVFAATAWLLAPSLPARAFSAWYTADLPEMAFYRGRVLRTTLGPMSFRPDRLPDREAVRRLLLEGAPLRIDAVAGPPAHALAPLFVIEDEDDNEVFLVGPDRDDLVVRYRSRAWLWRLDEPDLRLRGAFAGLVPGDTIRITVERRPDGYCLSLNRMTRCGIGYSVGSGWSVLYYARHFPPWVFPLLDAGLIAGLVLPVGYWARRRPETALAAVLLAAGLFALPLVTGLVRTPPHELAGAAMGLLVGGGLRALVQRAGAGVAPVRAPGA